jgi:hypothetical protein
VLFWRVGNGPLLARLADGNTFGYATPAEGLILDGVTGLLATSDLVDGADLRRCGGVGNAESGMAGKVASVPSESVLVLARARCSASQLAA